MGWIDHKNGFQEFWLKSSWRDGKTLRWTLQIRWQLRNWKVQFNQRNKRRVCSTCEMWVDKQHMESWDAHLKKWQRSIIQGYQWKCILDPRPSLLFLTTRREGLWDWVWPKWRWHVELRAEEPPTMTTILTLIEEILGRTDHSNASGFGHVQHNISKG